MKVLPVIWLITVGCHVSHQTYDLLCWKENKGFLRHPHDCHRFIRCSHQRAYEFQCPANLLWHHEIKSCDFSYRTQCKLNDVNEGNEKDNNELKKVERKREEKLGDRPQIGNIFACTKPVSKKVKRNTGNKQKYQTTVRETVKTADFIQHTVRDITPSMLKDITVKLTGPVKESMTTMIIKPQKPTNPPITVQVTKAEIRKSVLAFSINSTKNPHNILTVNKTDKITDEELNTVRPKKISSSLNSLDTFIKNNDSKIKQENITKLKLKMKQNSLLEITTEVNSVNLTQAMLTSNPAKISFNKTMPEEVINAIDLKEINHRPVIFTKQIDSSSSILNLTDNSTVKITDEEIANKFLPTKSTASSLSSASYYRNITTTKPAITARVNSGNLTEAKLTSYATESMTNLNSTVLEEDTIFNSLTELKTNPVTVSFIKQSPVNTLSLTDKAAVKIKDGENKDISSTLEYNGNMLYPTKTSDVTISTNITTEIAFETRAREESVNLTESVLTRYAAENFANNVHSTNSEQKTNSVNLMKLKGPSITSDAYKKNSVNSLSLTDNTTVKLVDKEKEILSATTKDNAYLFNSTERITDFNMKENVLTESVLHITAKENSVELTAAMLTHNATQISTFISNSTKPDDIKNTENITEITKLPVTLTESSLNILKLTADLSVKRTDKENKKNIFVTTKNPLNSINFNKNASESFNRNLTEESTFKIKFKNNSVNLTEKVLTEFSRPYSIPIFDSTKIQEETNSDNFIELTAIPVTLSEITKNMNSVNLTHNSTDHLTDAEIIESFKLTTKDPIENDRLYNLTEFELQKPAKDNSVNLTEPTLTHHLEPFQSTVTDFAKISDIRNDYIATNFDLTENISVKTTDPKNKNLTEAVKPEHFSNKQRLLANQANILTEALTEIITKNVNDSKAETNSTATSKVYNNSKVREVKNLTNLSSGRNTNDQITLSTPEVPTTLNNIFTNDRATIHDPRLPFRSIECQGPNNRRQLKAIKCYQYYQCFAGWAFLLNCHDGYRFETKEEKCVLDVNQECDFE